MDPLEKLKRDLSMQRNDMSNFVTGGGPTDFSAYSKAVGSIQTLDMVLAMIEELENNRIED